MIRFVILSVLLAGCMEPYNVGRMEPYNVGRDSAAIEACGKACGQIEEIESASAKRVYPCLEGVSFTTHPGGTDLACRCRCGAPDGGETPREVWR